jgi:hypothetical protein
VAFQFQPYENNSLGAILQLMQAGPHAQAEAARASAAARAAAVQQQGQTSAQLAGSLGSILSGTANQIASTYGPEAQMRRESAEALADDRKAQTEDRRQKMAAAETERAQRGRLNALLQESTTTDPDTGVVIYDRTKLTTGLTALGLGDKAPEYLKLLDNSDAAVKTARAAQADALKRIATVVDATGNDATVFGNEVQRAIKNGVISDRMAAPYLDAARRDPAHVGRITGALLGKTPHLQTVNPGDAVIDANNPQAGALYTAPPKPDKKSFEQKSVLLNGKEAVVSFDPSTGKSFDASGADVSQAVKPMPPAATRVTVNAGPAQGDFEKTGEDFLQTIPAQWRNTVKKIASYDEDPTKSVAMRSGMRDKVMQWVNQVNPGYKSDEFAVRAPTRKAFTTGTQGQQINAINTAIGHIDQITGLADKLQNGGFVPGNAAWNAIQTMFGSDKVTNFDTLKDALAGEVSSVLAKGGATVSGIAEAKQKISGANSPEQLAGYVKTLIPVMGSKLASLDYQYHQAMGAEDKFSALSPESKQILQKYGFDPAHPTGEPGSSVASGAAPGGISYQDYLNAKKKPGGG